MERKKWKAAYDETDDKDAERRYSANVEACKSEATSDKRQQRAETTAKGSVDRDAQDAKDAADLANDASTAELQKR